ncbi:hypothetical protein ACFQGT_18460 [Natrialbaceae archaeon GCM10025810]|uniref:thiolase C-terminal domain-containing protein n=1 Tax=Halovalidus salilacus TaxID=3075124 RepID=UPI003613A899
MEYEALGLCEKGERVRPDTSSARRCDARRRYPVNPSDGVLTPNAGICASLSRHAEDVLQLMNEAGDRQIPDARTGLSHSWG